MPEVGDLLSMVDDLADRLMEGGREHAPSYALERNITMPSQTDLELRIPALTEAFKIEMEDYVIEVRTEPSGAKVKITRGGNPVSGTRVRMLRGDKKSVVCTNEEGEAFIGWEHQGH